MSLSILYIFNFFYASLRHLLLINLQQKIIKLRNTIRVVVISIESGGMFFITYCYIVELLLKQLDIEVIFSPRVQHKGLADFLSWTVDLKSNNRSLNLPGF